MLFVVLALVVLKVPHRAGPKSVRVMVVSAWLTWFMALSEAANAWWGANQMLPIAAKQAGATGAAAWQEAVVKLCHLPAALGLIRRVDAFINHTEPFKLAKDETKRAELAAILYQCLEAVRIASLLLWAVMPNKMAELWVALGLRIDPAAGELGELAQWGGILPGATVNKIALFPRMEQPQMQTAGA